MTEPLWDASAVPYPYPNNAIFVREYTIKLLSTSFPNMTAAEVWIPPSLPTLRGKKRLYLLVWPVFQVAQFVNGMFDTRNDLSAFKDRIRDFLVQSKEFSAQVSPIICVPYSS